MEEERNRLATERGQSSTPSDLQEASAHYAPSPIREAEPMNPISSPLSPAAPADQSNDDDDDFFYACLFRRPNQKPPSFCPFSKELPLFTLHFFQDGDGDCKPFRKRNGCCQDLRKEEAECFGFLFAFPLISRQRSSGRSSGWGIRTSPSGLAMRSTPSSARPGL